jgi:hypothetical protein
VHLQPQVELNAQPRGVKPVGALAVEALGAEPGGLFEEPGLDGGVDVFERKLALARHEHPLLQRHRGEGLEQVAVERRFGRLGHLAVAPLARHHDEYGGPAQQVRLAAFVEQLVAGLAPALALAHMEVHLAEHHVVAAHFEAFAGVEHRGAMHHGLQADVAQLRAEHAA